MGCGTQYTQRCDYCRTLGLVARRWERGLMDVVQWDKYLSGKVSRGGGLYGAAWL